MVTRWEVTWHNVTSKPTCWRPLRSQLWFQLHIFSHSLIQTFDICYYLLLFVARISSWLSPTPPDLAHQSWCGVVFSPFRCRFERNRPRVFPSGGSDSDRPAAAGCPAGAEQKWAKLPSSEVKPNLPKAVTPSCLVLSETLGRSDDQADVSPLYNTFFVIIFHPSCHQHCTRMGCFLLAYSFCHCQAPIAVNFAFQNSLEVPQTVGETSKFMAVSEETMWNSPKIEKLVACRRDTGGVGKVTDSIRRLQVEDANKCHMCRLYLMPLSPT